MGQFGGKALPSLALMDAEKRVGLCLEEAVGVTQGSEQRNQKNRRQHGVETLGEDEVAFPKHLQGCPEAEGKARLTEAGAGPGGGAELKRGGTFSQPICPAPGHQSAACHRECRWVLVTWPVLGRPGFWDEPCCLIGLCSSQLHGLGWAISLL